MSIGDQTDMFNRLKNYIPQGWFSDDDVDFLAILQGYAAQAAFLYSLTKYSELQTRLQTATGTSLEGYSKDYLNYRLKRKFKESDDSYRHRIQAYIFPERNTVNAYIRILTAITGRVPVVLEGFNPLQTNYLNGNFFLNVNSLGTAEPFTIYILAFRPTQLGGAINGLNNENYSLNCGNQYPPAGFTLGDPNGILIGDEDILDAIDWVHMAGITVITYIFD